MTSSILNILPVRAPDPTPLPASELVESPAMEESFSPSDASTPASPVRPIASALAALGHPSQSHDEHAPPLHTPAGMAEPLIVSGTWDRDAGAVPAADGLETLAFHTPQPHSLEDQGGRTAGAQLPERAASPIALLEEGDAVMPLAIVPYQRQPDAHPGDIPRVTDGAILMATLRNLATVQAVVGVWNFVRNYIPSLSVGRQAEAPPIPAAAAAPSVTYLGVASDALNVARQAISLADFAVRNPDQVVEAVSTIRRAVTGSSAQPLMIAEEPPQPAAAVEGPSSLAVVSQALPILQAVVDATRTFLDNPEDVAIRVGASVQEASRAFQSAVQGMPAIEDVPVVDEHPPAVHAAVTDSPAAVISQALPIAQSTIDATRTFLDNPAAVATRIGSSVLQASRAFQLAVIGTPAGGPQAAPLAAPAEAVAATPAADTIHGLLGLMGGWIQSGIRNQTMNMLFSGLSLILTQAKSETTDAALLTQLDDMIVEIERVKAGNGNFDALKANLTRILNGQDANGAQVRNILQLHFNGWFQLPLRAEEAEAISSKEILAANIRAIPEETATVPIDYQRGIVVMQDRLVKNISASVAIQLTNQFMCNRLISEEKISGILGGCSRDDNYLINIRDNLYAEINTLDLAWHNKLGAKISFALICLSSNYYLRRFLSSLIEKIDKAVKPGSSLEIQALHNAIVRKANNYLSILKGTIKRVNEDASPTANHMIMIEQELAQPKFNHGYTKERLYSEATSKAIYEILPPLGWTQGFNEATAKLPAVLQWSFLPLIFSMRLVVYVFESLGNKIVRSIIHSIMTQSNILERIIDKSIGQVYRNGYTHSINKIIYDQLRHMWQAIEDDASSSTDPKATVANREELRQLVVNLYDVLELNRRARHADSDLTFLEKAKSAVYKMTTDYSADVIALIIDKAKNVFLKPDLVPMREFSVLEALNAALESTETAPEEEMIKTEQNIIELSDAILYRATQTVVRERFSSAPTQMQQLFQRFTSRLKRETSLFVVQARLLVGTTNKVGILVKLKKLNRDVLNLQKLVEADPYVSSESMLFDQHYTRPLAEKLSRMSTAVYADEADEQTAILQEIENWVAQVPDVKHVNSAVLPFNQLAEGLAGNIVFRAGKEFFDEAWRALRTPYNWLYGAVHHGMLIPFVESKKENPPI